MNVYALLAALTILTLIGAAVGIKLAEVPSASRRVLLFSGGLLVGIALFWILPEVALRSGWLPSLAGLTAGFAGLSLIDRFLYPVCPTCTHVHSHGNGHHDLHGFAVPLILASGIHSFFDGWSLVVSEQKGFETFRMAFLAGIGVHKLPEGLALGAILVAAVGSTAGAMLGAAAAQAMMIAGGAAAVVFAPHLDASWTLGFLAVAAGAFLYLGYHTVENARRTQPGVISVVPALTGVIGAAALRTLLPRI